MRSPGADDYDQLCRWPPGIQAATRWAGPDFKHWPPADGQALQRLLYGPNSTFGVLADASDQMIAFGQYYLAKTERLRLARLIVSPEQRGQRIIDRLVAALCAAGEARFGPRDVELGIYRDNASAIRAYRRLGFEAFESEIRRGRPSVDVMDMIRRQ